MTAPALRAPPSNTDAEKALLGALFANPRTYEIVSEFLRPEHFAVAEHGRIFDACARLIETGKLANPVTLRTLFESEETLAQIGGAAYLAELANSAVTVLNAGQYARLIRDDWEKRQLIVMAEELLSDSYTADEAPAIRARHEARLAELALQPGSGEPRPFAEFVSDALDEVDRAMRAPESMLSTGLKALDAATGGPRPGELWLIAGRPAMGKTALGFHTAAKCGAPALMFSLEMPGAQLGLRQVAGHAGVSSVDARAGKIEVYDFERMYQTRGEVMGLSVLIDDRAGLSLSQIAAAARRAKAKHGIGLIVVDYLHLIDEEAENRNQAISKISVGLKRLARRLGVPVIALSQLSRAVEGRDDKRPTLADLRDSGSLEQDADVVMFIYREEYYLERSEPAAKAGESEEKFEQRLIAHRSRLERARNRADIIIAKQRQGPTTTVRVVFEAARTAFYDF